VSVVSVESKSRDRWISGYRRQKRDLYETPSWVTELLLPQIPRDIRTIWECACGSGQMASVLRAAGFDVVGTDIAMGHDFLDETQRCRFRAVDGVVTNPPYGRRHTLAVAFVENCMAAMRRDEIRLTAMLLPAEFDYSHTKQHLFSECPFFARKLVITRRIVWFQSDDPDKREAPKNNHAWFIWERHHEGRPQIFYCHPRREYAATNDVRIWWDGKV